jgi:hypothetical protein
MFYYIKLKAHKMLLKTIINSGITKQKDMKLVIQMKCNLEL